MFPEMRRKKQALTMEECEEILRKGTSGVLAVSGNDNYPYAVPLSYIYWNGKLYFHCAKSGHKLDAIARNEKASFCVIGQDRVLPEEYTTDYRSVIVFGKICILEDSAAKRAAIEALGRKYAPEASDAHLQTEIDSYWKPLCVLEMTIDRMSGKRRK